MYERKTWGAGANRESLETSVPEKAVDRHGIEKGDELTVQVLEVEGESVDQPDRYTFYPMVREGNADGTLEFTIRHDVARRAGVEEGDYVTLWIVELEDDGSGEN